MAGRSKLDSIKHRLDIENLDLETRRKMFEDLKKAGGRVIDLDAEEKTKKLISSSSSTSSYSSSPSKPVGSGAPRKFKSSAKKHDHSKKSSPMRQIVKSSMRTTDIEQKYSLFTLWGFKLNCIVSWIFNFSGTDFRHRFIRLVLIRYRNILLSLKIFLDPVFSASNLQSLEFREQFYRMNSLQDYELAYRMFTLYNDQLFESLEKNLRKSVFTAKDDLKKLFADLYLLKPYAARIKVACMLVLQRFSRFNQKGVVGNYSQDKIDRFFNFIWDQFYWEMDNLMNYYCADESKVSNKVLTFDEFLNIKNTKPIGSYAEEWKQIHMLKDIEDQEESQKEFADADSSQDSDLFAGVEFPNDIVREGVDFLVKSVDFNFYYKKFKESNDLRSFFEPSDKLLYTYAIVDFFDIEFSFLWTSILNFYVLSDGSIGRYDPKKELANLSNRLNQFYEMVNDYLRLLRNHNELSRTQTSAQRLQFEQKEKELSRASYNVRNILSKLMQDYDAIFSRLIKLQESGETIVGNWNEPITLKIKNSNRIVNEMLVKDAVALAQVIVHTTSWLLQRSDLSGLGFRLIQPRIIPQYLLEE